MAVYSRSVRGILPPHHTYLLPFPSYLPSSLQKLPYQPKPAAASDAAAFSFIPWYVFFDGGGRNSARYQFVAFAHFSVGGRRD